ncbi:MAG: YdcF family protein [Alphaproteobacteria bacterium]|nr:YdcF family protein [Alphaproteobacteria bacterium]
MLERIYHTVFGFLIEAEFVICTLLVIAALLMFTKRKKAARITLMIGLVFFILAGLTTLAPWMLSTLENRFDQPHQIPLDLKGMIILGGSFNRTLSVERDTTCYNSAGGRLIEAYRLVSKNPHLPILFSGGGVVLANAETEAKMALDVARDLGIDTKRFIIEDKSTNTRENASFSYTLMNPAPQDKWLLITSAAHMPRAVTDFRAAGWQVVPYPVDYLAPKTVPISVNLNINKNFQTWSRAAREWAGLARDYLSGKTTEFFPIP